MSNIRIHSERSDDWWSMNIQIFIDDINYPVSLYSEILLDAGFTISTLKDAIELIDELTRQELRNQSITDDVIDEVLIKLKESNLIKLYDICH